jgi:hypothetical protein
MEVTNKSIIAVVAPVLITAVAGLVDNAMKWRSEMEQKEYDRQTRILDKIIAIPAADQRLAVANFYISTGTFSGKYLRELEQAIKVAEVLPHPLSEGSDLIADASAPSSDDPTLPEFAVLMPPPQPNEEVPQEQSTELAPAAPSMSLPRTTIPLTIPETIFSFDKSPESRKIQVN